MENSDFYNSIKKIADHKNTVALIDIKEFRRLVRIKGEYKWIPFTIGNLPALPIKTDYKEQFRSTKERVNIRVTPLWSFLTNGKSIITPNIERFEIIERTGFNPRYMITRTIAFNRHCLSNGNWHNQDEIIVQRENAVEWIKRRNATLLSPISDEYLSTYMDHYQDELQTFNNLYEESENKILEIRRHQKKIK